MIFDEHYLTIAEAEGALGVSRATIWRWHRLGKLRIKTVGNRRLIPASELITRSVVEGKIARGLPILALDNHPLTQTEAHTIAETVAAVLERSGITVSSTGLLPLLRGEEPVQPIFWRYLQRGILKLRKQPAPWTPSDAEIAEISDLARQEGIGFWEAAMRVDTSTSEREPVDELSVADQKS